MIRTEVNMAIYGEGWLPTPHELEQLVETVKHHVIRGNTRYGVSETENVKCDITFSSHVFDTAPGGKAGDKISVNDPTPINAWSKAVSYCNMINEHNGWTTELPPEYSSAYTNPGIYDLCIMEPYYRDSNSKEDRHIFCLVRDLKTDNILIDNLRVNGMTPHSIRMAVGSVRGAMKQGLRNGKQEAINTLCTKFSEFIGCKPTSRQ